MKILPTELGTTLGKLKEKLWEEMNLEIAKHGYSDHTLFLESAVYDIQEIIDRNNFEE